VHWEGWAYCRGGPIVEGGPVVGPRSSGGGLIVKGGPVVKGGPIVKERGYLDFFWAVFGYLANATRLFWDICEFVSTGCTFTTPTVCDI
jgi:hypothetical protein